VPLTPRQAQILCLYAQGLRRPEIAGLLHIGERTIDRQLEEIRGRLGTRTIAQSIVVSVARGHLCLDGASERVLIPGELVAA